ncbi:winged helix-turn-helix transcriptional regulator [Pusillimonas sp. MFBS29]|uniref:winged helix-turn-helix transcriptional regulator n=1 Tax=Pusillimonas sp. MFBS29 TaxID=2886690 RepID=UPI001D11E8A5|nr:winged helix-turn-helix transcriptional regulator [Pusillimonas sp. MFBS29]MCC2596799.1 winged helix-turn-helix transcriptional regulator [Pusillimonas sp. MFBS29]
MQTRRSYDDGCAAAHALDLIGDRWALLIVRELLLGPKRFSGLRSGLPNISPNVLTQRLNELEAGQVLQRRKLPQPASAWVYELTEWGQSLEPILLQLAHWGVRSPAFVRGAPLGIDAVVLSLKAMFRPDTATGVDACIQLHFDNEVFSATIKDGELEILRGPALRPAATLSTSPQRMLSLVYGKSDIDEVVSAGMADYSGDRSALDAFFCAFALPPPALQSGA